MNNKKALFVLTSIGFLSSVVLYLPLLPIANNATLIKIPPHLKTAKEISYHLAGKGALRAPRLFALLLQLGQWDTRIKKGTYKLRRPEPWPRLLMKLIRGETVTVKLSVPEGWRAAQIAQALVKNGILSESETFLKIVDQEKLEGYLFPSTYNFDPASDAQTIAQTMVETFRKTWDTNFKEKPHTSALAPRQVLILASIIERESMVKEEMPLMAGVYLNRLKKGWKLEADPTVQYALGYWKERVMYNDLKINSPYNTYLNRGLPPGPISNPGLDAIKAVYAAPKTPYMYFVAKGDSTHGFYETLEEHSRAKRKAKRDRLKQRR